MARGWESKSVESQQADRDEQTRRGIAVILEPPAQRQRREAIELALARTRRDLTTATHAAHRTMLEAAIGDLQAQLRNLP
jgi:hypothetical protein